jgi:hypothetical protein
MISISYKKIIKILIVLGIVIVIAMPDLIVGLLFSLVHFFFELIFEVAAISFEWLETFLDHIVEHLFETELHETQTIVFYIISFIALFPIYALWRVLPDFYLRVKNALLTGWQINKYKATHYWQELTLNDKIKVGIITIISIYLGLFVFI